MTENETNLGFGRVLGGEESVAGTLVPLPSSPPNPVDVVLAVAGVVVVDDEFDVVNIQAPDQITTLYLETFTELLTLRPRPWRPGWRGGPA